MKEIYYIAGAGRSGSTLLDIILGNSSSHFSLGELNFFVQNGILDDNYCSCGQRVHECEIWSEVISLWDKNRTLSVEEYRNAQWKYFRNKSTIITLFNFWFPSKLFRRFMDDTRKLYIIIFNLVNKEILIDSSKNAQYILLLRKLGLPYKIIHITRSLSGVLSSTKKVLNTNPEMGVEKIIESKSFLYTLIVWLLDNTFVYIFSKKKNKVRIKYEELIENPIRTIKRIYEIDTVDELRLKERGPFYALHLVAGGRVRMKDKIYIDKTIDNTNTEKLNLFKRNIIWFLQKLY